jgi:hypothetical protein
VFVKGAPSVFLGKNDITVFEIQVFLQEFNKLWNQKYTVLTLNKSFDRSRKPLQSGLA